MRIPLLKWAMIILATTDIGGQLTLSTFADETAIDDVNKADAAKAAELAKMELAQWKFSCGAKPSRELTLVAMPILRWSNPTVGRVHGNLYVLTDDDCPQVIVCPYKFFAPWTGFDMECVSLSSSEVHGRRNEKVIWSSGHTAIDWKPVPDSPVVGKSSAERQRQLKQLAAEFVAELVDRRVNDNGEDQQLRLYNIAKE